MLTQKAANMSRTWVKLKLSPSKKRYPKAKIFMTIKAQLFFPHRFFKKLEAYLKEDWPC